ncbi:MAG TPA: hypothetical protein VNO21_02115 [Polyangiaceae bacterium]|nr:hypothetical protein [Polyangiaceae bacterium]
MDKRILFPLVLVAIAASIGIVACSGSSDPGGGGNGGGTTGGQDNGIGTGGNGDGTGNGDGSGDGDSGVAEDGGTWTDAGTHSDASSPKPDAGNSAFGKACTVAGDPGDCPADLQCVNFRQTGLHCTRTCTNASDCPEIGRCGGNGYCAVNP